MFSLTRRDSAERGKNIFLSPVDLAIEFCRLAEESLGRNDRTGEDYFVLASESVKTLGDRVNLVYGGAPALLMQSEYRFVIEQIGLAGQTGNVENIRVAIRILEYIRQQTLTFIAAAKSWSGERYTTAVAWSDQLNQLG